MEERRQFIRLDTRVEATYALEPEQVGKKTRTKSLGAGGICLFTSEPVRPGTRLRVTLQLPDRQDPLVFDGQTMWSEVFEVRGRDAEIERRVETGVKFLDISAGDLLLLNQYVILGLKSKPPAPDVTA